MMTNQHLHLEVLIPQQLPMGTHAASLGMEVHQKLSQKDGDERMIHTETRQHNQIRQDTKFRPAGRPRSC